MNFLEHLVDFDEVLLRCVIRTACLATRDDLLLFIEALGLRPLIEQTRSRAFRAHIKLLFFPKIEVEGSLSHF